MNPFIDTIQKARRGEAVKHADELFQKVFDAVKQTQRKGEIVCKLTITPKGNDQYGIAFESTPKMPVKIIGETILYADGPRFSYNDPNQPEFNLRIEDGNKQEEDLDEAESI